MSETQISSVVISLRFHDRMKLRWNSEKGLYVECFFYTREEAVKIIEGLFDAAEGIHSELTDWVLPGEGI